MLIIDFWDNSYITYDVLIIVYVVSKLPVSERPIKIKIIIMRPWVINIYVELW